MNRGLALWASLALVLSVVVTGSVVAVFPDHDSPVIPTSIPVTAPAPWKAPAPVSFPVVVVGKTVNAALTRGGQATQTPTSGEAGMVSVPVQTAP
jgi:hypothetical protein